MIKNLESEKDELTKDLRLAESRSNEKKDDQRTEVLGQLLESKDKREKEIKDEKDKTKELDIKIQEWEKKIRTKRREIGGSNAGSNFVAHSKKQEKVLENRLDHVSLIFLSITSLKYIFLFIQQTLLTRH